MPRRPFPRPALTELILAVIAAGSLGFLLTSSALARNPPCDPMTAGDCSLIA